MPNNPLLPADILNYYQWSAQNGINPPQLPAGYVLATDPTTTGILALRLFDAAYITTGIIDPNRLGTGATGAGNLYLADDGTWKPVAGGGGGGDMYKCFHPDTELLTLNGWKKITDISFDDEVATLNQETKELEYQVPNHIFKYEYDGELLGRETKQLSYLVTPNHRMYVRKWYGGQRGLVWSEDFYWERADEVSEKIRSFPITAKWNGVKTETNPFGIDDDLFLEFLGWFLAEGCVVGTKIYVTQTKSKTIADCTKVMVELARSLGRTLAHNQNAHFNFRHSELAKFLSQFGKHAHNKFIPSFVKNLPPEKLILFYSAYYKGDGHLNSNNITTVSKRMADDLQEIILKLGGYATITKCSPAITSYGVRDFYRLNCNFNNLQGSTAKKDNYKIDYKGFVHCVEVDNATLYTRFNGKPVFLGNSTYDTDNSGIVDKAEALMTLGRNSTGATLYKGTVIRIQGSTGHLPNFVKAQGNNDANSAQTFGVVATDINNNSDGYVIVQGTIDTLDTRSVATHPFTDVTLVDGDILYLHPTIPGYLTNVKPSAPQHLVYVGVVTRTSPTNGTIVYRIQNGYELHELHDVAIASEVNNDLLVYESSTDLWKNKTISTIFGGTPLVSVPTLAQVTTAGNTTTNAITVGGATVNTTVNAGGIILQQNGTNIGEFRRVGNNNRGALYLINSGTTEILLETGGFSYIRSNGLGIGTATDAGYKLDVNGTVRVKGNIDLADQMDRYIYGFGGSYIKFYDNLTGGLDIYNVSGTGATRNYGRLEVYGNLSTTGSFSMNGNLNIGNGNFLAADPSNYNRIYPYNGANANMRFVLGHPTAGDFDWEYPINTVLVRLKRNGNFLIGTTTDSGYKLDVNGTIRSSSVISGLQLTNTNSNPVIGSDGSNIALGVNFASRIVMAGTNIDFIANSVTVARFASSNGGVYIGGAVVPTAKLQVAGSITAASALAQGVYFNNTLVAAANNDVLVGLDINPTFTNGAFTGVTNYALRLYNSIKFETLSNLSHGLYWSPANDGTTLKIYGSNYSGGLGYLQLNVQSGVDGLVVNGSSRTLTINAAGSNINITPQNTIFNHNGTGESMRIVSLTKNVLIGTTTDSGYKLDVVGADSRFNGVRVGLGAGGVSSNTVVGVTALGNNTTGAGITAVGYQSAFSNTTGAITAIGHRAGYNNTTGINNTVLGGDAFYFNTTGSANVAVGFGSLQQNVSGNNNTAIGGGGVLYYNTASNNTAVGFQAGFNNTSGDDNVAVGYQSAITNTTGYQNTSMGRDSLRFNTTGYLNVAIGRDSLRSNNTGAENVAIGSNVMRQGNGSGNTAVGQSALYSSSANNNTAIGAYAGQAGVANTTGANNIFIGYQATGVSATESNRTWIGNSSTTSTWVGGNLLVGTTTNAGYKLDVNGTARITSSLRLDTEIVPAASSYSNGPLVSFVTSSGWAAGKRPGMSFWGQSNSGAYLYFNGALDFKAINDAGSTMTFASTVFVTSQGYTSNVGTVTSVATGTGLSGGTITGSGTISLANTAVTAGAYTNANITVDAQGRITAASNGSGGGGSTSTISIGATSSSNVYSSASVVGHMKFEYWSTNNPASGKQETGVIYVTYYPGPIGGFNYWLDVQTTTPDSTAPLSFTITGGPTLDINITNPNLYGVDITYKITTF